VKLLAPLACAALVTGCSHGLLLQDHRLAGRIWSPTTNAFVTAQQALGRAARARHVILGEAHDNPEHHRLHRTVLEVLAQHGGVRSLALEQFDAEHQEAIEAVRAKGAGVEALADAGRFDRASWDWPHYRPLVEFALEHGWPLVAANLSRAIARAIVQDATRSGLPAADPALRAALERDIVDGHCGRRPAQIRLAGMVEAQRARDARMAQALAARPDPGSVLITGNAHARKDRGVPLYVYPADVVTIGFIEVEAGKFVPGDYVTRGFASAESFDFIWFTPRAEREDPCARLVRSVGGGKAL